jgi:LPXTG-motif cell wall-anchored protein
VKVSPAGSAEVVINGSASSTYPFEHYFGADTPVQLEIIPAEGFHFRSWSGSIFEKDATTEIIMDCDKTIIANLSPAEDGGNQNGLLVVVGTIILTVLGAWVFVRKRSASK